MHMSNLHTYQHFLAAATKLFVLETLVENFVSTRTNWVSFWRTSWRYKLSYFPFRANGFLVHSLLFSSRANNGIYEVWLYNITRLEKKHHRSSRLSLSLKLKCDYLECIVTILGYYTEYVVSTVKKSIKLTGLKSWSRLFFLGICGTNWLNCTVCTRSTLLVRKCRWMWLLLFLVRFCITNTSNYQLFDHLWTHCDRSNWPNILLAHWDLHFALQHAW